jgi:hypothetical protein
MHAANLAHVVATEGRFCRCSPGRIPQGRFATGVIDGARTSHTTMIDRARDSADMAASLIDLQS